MKRIMIAVVLLTLLLSLLAFAQQEPQKTPTDQMGKMGRMGMMQGMMRGEGGPAEAPMAFLKLTDEQRAKMQDHPSCPSEGNPSTSFTVAETACRSEAGAHGGQIQ